MQAHRKITDVAGAEKELEAGGAMPGKIMENSHVNGTWSGGEQKPGTRDANTNSSHYLDKAKASVNGSNGQSTMNGVQSRRDRSYGDSNMFSTPAEKNETSQALSKVVAEAPPQLAHITEGFFPLGTLISRTTQQCWLDLNDLINDLAEMSAAAPSQQQAFGHGHMNGRAAGGQAEGSALKKVRILQFAQRYRADFIKLLVISEWARQSAAVSKVIDIQGWIYSQNVAYDGAIWHIGDMKRNLAMAQMPNPDLKTALEVLATGKVSSLSDVSRAMSYFECLC